MTGKHSTPLLWIVGRLFSLVPWMMAGCLLGLFVGDLYAGRATTKDPLSGSRGIMVCAMDTDRGDDIQTISYVPEWTPPDSWRCSVVLPPVEWHPEDPAWADALAFDIGGACGWSSPASACCPACLAWEGGCPSSEEGCRVDHSR